MVHKNVTQVLDEIRELRRRTSVATIAALDIERPISLRHSA